MAVGHDAHLDVSPATRRKGELRESETPLGRGGGLLELAPPDRDSMMGVPGRGSIKPRPTDAPDLRPRTLPILLVQSGVTALERQFLAGDPRPPDMRPDVEDVAVDGDE